MGDADEDNLVAIVSGHRADARHGVRRAFTLIPWDSLAGPGRVLLNPGFGKASEELGGADADLMVGDALVDVKSGRRCSVGIEAIRAVVAYALIANHFGVTGHRRVHIERVGIYLARIGEIQVFSLRDCIDETDEEGVLEVLFGRRGRMAV